MYYLILYKSKENSFSLLNSNNYEKYLICLSENNILTFINIIKYCFCLCCILR